MSWCAKHTLAQMKSFEAGAIQQFQHLILLNHFCSRFLNVSTLGQNSCLNQSFSMLCIQRNGMYALKSIQKKKKKSRLCWRNTFSLTQWLWISFDSSRISFNESLSLQFSAVVVKRLNYISDTILIKFAALKILCLMVYVKLGWLSYCQCGEVIQKIGTRGNNRSLKKRLSREKVP